MLSGKSAVVRITEHDAPLEISEGRYQLRLAQTADEKYVRKLLLVR